METAQNPQAAKIHTAICAIMGEVGGVGKNRTNPQQNYKFRGIADLYLACQPLMAKHGVHVAPVAIEHQEMLLGKTKNGGDSYHVTIRVRFRAYATDGSYVELQTIGEAMDTSDKAYNKAESAAMKYALIQLFAIPEEDPELDTESSSPEQTTGGAGKAEDKGKVEDKGKAAPASDGAGKAGAKPTPIKALLELLAKAGKEKPADVLKWMTERTKRTIKATKELTQAEVAQLTADAEVLAKEAT